MSPVFLRYYIMNKFYRGYLPGIIASITYGLNPLFGLHLYGRGFDVNSVLFYRFVFAALLLGCWMMIHRVSFRLPVRQMHFVTGGGILLALSCWFWFLSFHDMDSGIGATIMFIYPLIVALIMALFYHERLDRFSLFGLFSGFAGVVVLCRPGEGSLITASGVVFVLLSSLSYALYIIEVKVSRLKDLAPETLTFYAMLTGVLFFFFVVRCGYSLQPLRTLSEFGNILGLAFFPSLLSFLLMAVAVRQIGATRTAILGALEPLTALIIGILVFHEALTLQLVCGMILILGAVALVVVQKKNCAMNSSNPLDDMKKE